MKIKRGGGRIQASNIQKEIDFFFRYIDIATEILNINISVQVITEMSIF